MSNPYQHDLFKKTGLIKFRGMLCIAEFNILPDGQAGKCPVCKGTEFITRHGWVECQNYECDFAISSSVFDR